MPESFLQGLDLFFATKGPDRFRSVAYPVAPTIEFILGMNATNEDAMNIGLADSTVIVSPMGTAKAQKRMIEQEGQYRLLNHARGKSVGDGDEKSMSDYGTNPVQGASEDKAVLKRFDGPLARTCWRNRILKVWHSDRDYASANGGGDKVQANRAIRSVYEVEQKDGLAAMALGFEKMLMGTHPDFPNGAPTDTSLTKWDSLFSIANTIHDSNTYLGVNRALAANAYFRGKRTTTARSPVLEDLLWEALMTDGILDTGGYIDLVITGKALFQKFWKEAQSKGFQQVFVDDIPDVQKFGTKRQAIAFGFNGRIVYVLVDPHCPEFDSNSNLIAQGTSGTFHHGHVYLLNCATWTVIIRGGKNFSKSPWVDKTKADPEGAERSDACVLETELMIVNEVPSWNKTYTNVTAS
jgi:hypothetical protein